MTPSVAAHILPSSPSSACAATCRRTCSSAPPSSNVTAPSWPAWPRRCLCRSSSAMPAGRRTPPASPWQILPPWWPRAESCLSSTRCCFPPTMCSTKAVISSRPNRSAFFPLCGEQLGITICEDVWNDKNFWAKRLYDRDPVAELVGQGTTVLLNLSASPYTIDKRNLRLGILQSLARSHRRPVVYVNQVGGNDSLLFDGSSIAVTADGRVAARARAFEEDLVLFDTATATGDIHPQTDDELEYAYLALVCGARDYVRKCGFRKVLVGLSGGIDSAVVAAIAAAAVGPENVLGVSMPGPYSSEGSL